MLNVFRIFYFLVKYYPKKQQKNLIQYNICVINYILPLLTLAEHRAIIYNYRHYNL